MSRLLSSLDAGAAQAKSSNVAYVDAAGDDSTGTMGDASKPFLTAQAAYNACVAAYNTVVATEAITSMTFMGGGVSVKVYVGSLTNFTAGKPVTISGSPNTGVNGTHTVAGDGSGFFTIGGLSGGSGTAAGGTASTIAAGVYTIWLGVGSFGGVTLSADWPAWITVAGAGKAVSQLGGVNGTGAGGDANNGWNGYAARNVTITGQDVDLGAVSVVGGTANDDGNGDTSNGGPAGSVTLTGDMLVSGGVDISGGSGNDVSGGNTGASGTAVLDLVTVNGVTDSDYTEQPGWTAGTLSWGRCRNMGTITVGTVNDMGGNTNW